MGGDHDRRWALASALCAEVAHGVLFANRVHGRPQPTRRRRPPRAVCGVVALLLVGASVGPWLPSLKRAEPTGRTALAAFVRRVATAEASAPPAPGEVAVAVAREQLGKPYRWAGAGPNVFDCSGLTSFAWRAAGVELPRTSRGQFSALPRIPLDELEPGDLVYSPGHIGLYVGDGQMIHAPVTGRHVEVAPLRQPLVGAVRPA